MIKTHAIIFQKKLLFEKKALYIFLTQENGMQTGFSFDVSYSPGDIVFIYMEKQTIKRLELLRRFSIFKNEHVPLWVFDVGLKFLAEGDPCPIVYEGIIKFLEGDLSLKDLGLCFLKNHGLWTPAVLECPWDLLKNS